MGSNRSLTSATMTTTVVMVTMGVRVVGCRRTVRWCVVCGSHRTPRMRSAGSKSCRSARKDPPHSGAKPSADFVEPVLLRFDLLSPPLLQPSTPLCV